ncbi:MAG: pyridoxal phosphate-dependent aminotransferase, partial [Agathobaculum sp.]
MDKPFLDKLRRIDPYVPGEQPQAADIIKLNANENPYPPAPGVQEALRTFDASSLALYPDANGKRLKAALAERFGLKPSQVFLGNGSDDVLALAFQSFFCSEGPILYPDITYSFYPVWCDLFRIPYETMPLDEDFCVNIRDYDRPNGGVVLPNPNAPTGRGLSLDALEDLLQHNADCVVIIDEAYVDFGAQSAVPLLDKYENLLVVQTMSKSRSLAGLRIGYALGSETLITTLEAVKNSYNSYTMDALALAAGEASVRDEDYFRQSCAKVIATRERAADALRELGFTVLPSLTNFLFVTHLKKEAPVI